MLRLLLQAGLGFATFNAGQKIARLKRSAIYFAAAGLIGLLGLGALTAALAIYLTPRFGAAGAAAIVGGGLVALAALIGWAGTWKARPKAPAPIFDRVRAEVGAAGAALSSAKASRSSRGAARTAEFDVEEALPPAPGSRRKRAVNMVLIATLAGVILGRRL